MLNKELTKGWMGNLRRRVDTWVSHWGDTGGNSGKTLGTSRVGFSPLRMSLHGNGSVTVRYSRTCIYFISPENFWEPVYPVVFVYVGFLCFVYGT